MRSQNVLPFRLRCRRLYSKARCGPVVYADPGASLRTSPAYAPPLNSNGTNGPVFDTSSGLNTFALMER
jgi:hypothetical protein